MTSPTDRAHQRRVVLAAGVGTMMEFYDFAIFGTAAALVFGTLFFPTASPGAGTLASFATFSAAFVARPLGGMVFGHFGDRLGRKRLLQISLIGMGVSTMLIGVLPTYAQAGILAPVLLVVLRVLQGVAAGGEVGGAVVTVLEHAPVNRRATLGAYVFACLSLGGVLASAVFLAVSTALRPEQFESWGWRIPFLLSIVLLGTGMYVRARLEETPDFRTVAESGGTARIPLFEVFRRHWRQVLLVVGVAGAYSIASFLVAVYVISFLAGPVGATRTFTLVAFVLSMSICAVFAVASGRAADTFGRRRVLAVGLAGVAVGAYPFFAVVGDGSPIPVLIVMGAMGAVVGIVGGPPRNPIFGGLPAEPAIQRFLGRVPGGVHRRWWVRPVHRGRALHGGRWAGVGGGALPGRCRRHRPDLPHLVTGPGWTPG